MLFSNANESQLLIAPRRASRASAENNGKKLALEGNASRLGRQNILHAFHLPSERCVYANTIEYIKMVANRSLLEGGLG